MKKRKKGRWIFYFATLFLIVLTGFLGIMFLELEEKKSERLGQKEYEESLLLEEERRKEELEKFRINMGSKKFIEDIARDEFGLVYENEIIFMPEKNE